ncbi:hypothetical protein [Photobacterium damselae]|uniref:hypothetical protein n=1 Tax=Photobacterium damselae TaxID=38293 RepID=UPI004067FE82
MWIKSVLDYQCEIVNHIVAFCAQLAIKYHEWQFNQGNIGESDFMEFKYHIGYRMGVAHNLATVALLILATLYACFIAPHIAGWVAVTVGNLRAKFGLQRKVWVYNPETDRERLESTPKEWSTYSSAKEADDCFAFEDRDALISSGMTDLPEQAGILCGEFNVGTIIAKGSTAYMFVFAFYFLWFGDAHWLVSIKPW